MYIYVNVYVYIASCVQCPRRLEEGARLAKTCSYRQLGAPKIKLRFSVRARSTLCVQAISPAQSITFEIKKIFENLRKI